MQWAIDKPERVGAAVLIASAAKLSAQNIAFNEIARQAITSDPAIPRRALSRSANANPDRGLGLARMIGHVTYLSDFGMGQKFGRELKSGDLSAARDVEFQVQSYLRHQGQSFSQRFDANTYLLMTRALDFFDPAGECGGDLVAALERAQSDFLVLSFSTGLALFGGALQGDCRCADRGPQERGQRRDRIRTWTRFLPAAAAALRQRLQGLHGPLGGCRQGGQR